MNFSKIALCTIIISGSAQVYGSVLLDADNDAQSYGNYLSCITLGCTGAVGFGVATALTQNPYLAAGTCASEVVAVSGHSCMKKFIASAAKRQEKNPVYGALLLANINARHMQR